MVWTDILYIVAIVFSILMCIVSTILTKKNTKKASTEVDGTGTQNSNGTAEELSQNVDSDNVSKGFWGEMWRKLPEYIIGAEQFYNHLIGNAGIKTGSQKLAQVLDKIKIDCLTANVPYDEQKAKTMVEELVNLTNEVNTNKR